MSHHKLGKNGRSGLPGCKKVWNSSDDVIAPITICEPEYERRYGDMVWACFSHWCNSVYPDEDENADNILNSAAYKFEAEALEKEEVNTRSRTKSVFDDDSMKEQDLSKTPTADDDPKPGCNKKVRPSTKVKSFSRKSSNTKASNSGEEVLKQ